MRKKSHPKFNVPNAGSGRKGKVRVKERWRRPRGIDNKKRIRKKAMGAVPKVGYKNPSKIRGRHPSGTFEALVSNVSELLNLKGVAVRIRAAVGKKKRAEIAAKAREMGLRILNGGVKE